MNLKEFRELTKDLPEETPIAMLLSDGELDYNTTGWINGPEEEIQIEELEIVIAGNWDSVGKNRRSRLDNGLE